MQSFYTQKCFIRWKELEENGEVLCDFLWVRPVSSDQDPAELEDSVLGMNCRVSSDLLDYVVFDGDFVEVDLMSVHLTILA